MPKQQLYSSLKRLQSKGIVTATCKRPALFSALPFEKLLDLFIEANIEEAQQTKQNMEKLLSIWQSMITEDATK
jgi:sugar-specific transcriptional regulator TrmB